MGQQRERKELKKEIKMSYVRVPTHHKKCKHCIMQTCTDTQLKNKNYTMKVKR